MLNFQYELVHPGGDSDGSEDGILDSWLQNIRRTLLECYVFFWWSQAEPLVSSMWIRQPEAVPHVKASTKSLLRMAWNQEH